MDPKHSKSELRRILRAKRAALSPAQQARAAEKLAGHVINTPVFRISRKIACYCAHDGEIDPRVVVEHIWETDKICYFPVVPRSSREPLWFAAADPSTPLAANRFGILEPVVEDNAFVRAQKLDLILLPLVGFDRNGNRIGMGGGYYDRSLSFLRDQKHMQKPRLIGLAHDFQRVDGIEATPRDIPLQAVITDKHVYTITEPEG